MPAVITRGAFSAKAFGFGANVAGPDATTGLFTTGYTNAVRQKYIFACNSNASAASISSGSTYNASAGNSTRTITALGFASSPSGASQVRRKYLWACNTDNSATSQSFAASCRKDATGNKTLGIFTRGSSSANRDKYIYACDSSPSTTASSTNASRGGASGNSTIAIFALGYVTSPYTQRNKYTYACAANASAASASAAVYEGGAMGNSTKGIFALGYASFCTSKIRNKFIYACCSSASGASSSASMCTPVGTGNSTFGVFGYNGSTSREKYTYATDSNSTSVAAFSCSIGNGQSAASNGITGVSS